MDDVYIYALYIAPYQRMFFLYNNKIYIQINLYIIYQWDNFKNTSFTLT